MKTKILCLCIAQCIVSGGENAGHMGLSPSLNPLSQSSTCSVAPCQNSDISEQAGIYHDLHTDSETGSVIDPKDIPSKQIAALLSIASRTTDIATQKQLNALLDEMKFNDAESETDEVTSTYKCESADKSQESRTEQLEAAERAMINAEYDKFYIELSDEFLNENNQIVSYLMEICSINERTLRKIVGEECHRLYIERNQIHQFVILLNKYLSYTAEYSTLDRNRTAKEQDDEFNSIKSSFLAEEANIRIAQSSTMIDEAQKYSNALLSEFIQHYIDFSEQDENIRRILLQNEQDISWNQLEIQMNKDYQLSYQTVTNNLILSLIKKDSESEKRNQEQDQRIEELKRKNAALEKRNKEQFDAMSKLSKSTKQEQDQKIEELKKKDAALEKRNKEQFDAMSKLSKSTKQEQDQKIEELKKKDAELEKRNQEQFDAISKLSKSTKQEQDQKIEELKKKDAKLEKRNKKQFDEMKEKAKKVDELYNRFSHALPFDFEIKNDKNTMLIEKGTKLPFTKEYALLRGDDSYHLYKNKQPMKNKLIDKQAGRLMCNNAYRAEICIYIDGRISVRLFHEKLEDNKRIQYIGNILTDGGFQEGV
ncbi:hypothetical protein FZC35_00375 [Candidatus Cytomitobacter indipagum]|uniref:Uncharacterized protein n=1 Tax=Candidatus Cytomitobacter indipagum TaxID=2601575 RepID=A0A5C0UCV5_9PROT|nr:hypothetical protein [Candidatus Cytomitobacter indipagum]QEK37845.1 hypothetical protein FZC35_00375 [Candidatus Cytomitobacter indipagum]